VGVNLGGVERRVACIAAALEAAPDEAGEEDRVDWSRAVVTPGGGVAATLAALRRARGPARKPRKTQLTVRYSPEVVAYFKATGKGWQARMDAALQDRGAAVKTRTVRA
jgi:uncharacterized protein (DUF4415 family)